MRWSGFSGGLGTVRQDLYRSATFSVRVSQAVGASVAAAEDDDVLVFGGDLHLRVRRQPGDPPILLHQVIHRQVDAAKLAARHVQVAPLQSADRQDYRVELAL